MTAQVRPPGWDDRQAEPPQYQPPAHDFSHVDLFAHAPQRPPVQLKLGEPQVESLDPEESSEESPYGQDVYLGAGKSTANDDLTAHELTPVVQQTGTAQTKRIQRAIDPTYDVTQGQFKVNATAGGSNLPISIDFQPNPTADYSNQISLIQIVRLTNPAGANVRPATLPPGRADSLRTAADASTGAEAGYFTDVYHSDPNAQPNAPLPPQYGYGPTGNPTGTGTMPTPGLSRPLSPTFAPVPEVGFKRSSDPADIKAARISDAPGYASATPVPPDLDFNFETVAKGEDVNKVYGALKWNFQIRAGVAQNEQATVQDAQSATFDAALDRHRDFYLHEPVIFYFEFDQAVLGPAEIAKIAGIKTYLARFAAAPKLVQVTPEGFADQRGNASHNLDLSLRRATAVRNALLAEGIPAAQINPVTAGSGATTGFTPDATTDQDDEANRRGNRRVVLTFQDTSPAPASPPSGGTP
jgi:outer membrane protein OmpA-like peptidoglycan-associated protein